MQRLDRVRISVESKFSKAQSIGEDSIYVDKDKILLEA